MASKKISMNVFGPSAAIAWTKATAQCTMDTVEHTETKKRNKCQTSTIKLISEWKNAWEINKMNFMEP